MPIPGPSSTYAGASGFPRSHRRYTCPVRPASPAMSGPLAREAKPSYLAGFQKGAHSHRPSPGVGNGASDGQGPASPAGAPFWAMSGPQTGEVTA